MPLALFGTFAALAWWALDFMAAAKPRTLERLEELKDPRKRRKAASRKRPEAIRRLHQGPGKGIPSLAKPLQPKNEAELGKLKTKLANAGFRSEAAGSIFLGLKFAGLVVGLFLGGGTITSLRGVNQKLAGLVGRRGRPAVLSARCWSSASSAAAASRRSSSPCPTPWT